MAEQLGLSSPWVHYVRKVKALFEKDPDITLQYNEDDYTLKLYIEDAAKADALSQLLPTEKDFGGVTLNIKVIPANNQDSKIALFQKAFYGNPVFSFSDGVEDVLTNPIYYFVFRNEVVQYFNDNLGDIYGLESTLYEDLARDVFEGQHESIYFCTDLPDDWDDED